MVAINKILKILEENKLLVEKDTHSIDNIDYISYNSKKVQKNTMFFCKGMHFKVDYLKEAIENGASIYISEEKYDVDLPYIIVNNIQRAVAIISCEYYDYPSTKIKSIGITGTKGKTTVTSFINNILNEFTHKRTGIASSINNYTGITDEEAVLTTAEAMDVQRFFNEAVESNLEYFTMEVSSQGYKKDRVFGVEYDYGLFLNIGEDHISDLEHPNFEDYFNCKLQLLKNSKNAILNKNMDCFVEVLNALPYKNVITYGSDSSADYYYDNVEKTENGFKFDVINKKNNYKQNFEINIPGKFNVENATAAVALAKELNVDDDSIKRGLSNTKVLGRMNLFEKNGIIVIVDYAHNKFSYTKLFETLKQDYPDYRIISVGGAEGSRAYNRRKEYAQIVGNIADYIYLTAIDPQYETAESIAKEIISHFEKDVKYEIIPDRKTAIETAILNAKKGDLIVITSKGGERWQKINGVPVKYESDPVVVEETLKKLDDMEE